MIDSPGTQELLNKVRRGLTWLRRNHNGWLEDQPQRHPDEEFGRVLEETAGLERTIRSLGYQGCLLGENETCGYCARTTPPPSQPSPTGVKRHIFSRA